ncbi:MAG: fatty acid desaturase [Deltaproteobacteria bacterium]|nr:fatty acid desaturase [Deltaproteobacteria bacterium]
MSNADLRPAFAPEGPFANRVAALLNDPRDVPFVSLIAQCLAWQVVSVSLFFVGDAVLWLAPVYWLTWGLGLLDRFILMLHCTSHRALFRDRRLNLLVPWVVGPFFGQTPESYFAHHMGMHHPENNLVADLSSTMKYDRSRLSHWLRYFGRFMIRGLPDLMLYHRSRGNTKMLRRLLLGEGAFWATIALLLFANWRATLVVFVLPVIAVRALMMAGNWGQHAFVKESDPGNAYLNSITCINTRYNRRCFNDGYHILHHIRPRTHYTEYPFEFEDHRGEYGSADAIVFEGIDFFQVWLYLMLGRWNWLAKCFVRLPGAPERTDAEVIELLRSRVSSSG